MIEILSTKKLTNPQKELLLKENINCFDEDFIKISPIEFESPTVIENAIFASKNAVKSILDREITIKNCFCVGDKTEAYLKKKGFSVTEKSYQAQALAEQIVRKHSEKEFTLFCGNIRREELPKLLKKNQIKLSEIEVYKTALTSKNMIRTYDGVLFFSPSAVESFAQRNLFEETTVFCIGKTTEAEARKHTNNIITANRSTIENVIIQVIKHYK
ncbi:uroporphyrinogen-III synthase [Galbibacter orientalis DSM 19592]|uniref:Uroporphyrinogen-III synthase n=1 Tax=Galbibacter orientalis DSM 19592 TaxID=926559 RepID=I3C4C4_9FLAO|nr:uroporphyrinogen-III synthase [Galbibacter orientalis]EIJ38467.1 uroporphyrinogen-III synthase [Galbibacter orientalis DSM 19592]